VVRPAGGDAALAATYTLAFTVTSPKTVTKLAGTTIDEPGLGASIAFDAAPGWKMAGTVSTTVTASPTLVGADATQTSLPPLRRAGRVRMRIATVVLAGGVGRYRLLLPGVAPGAWSLTLTPPRRVRLTETTAN
jgi:hypothetical protein